MKAQPNLPGMRGFLGHRGREPVTLRDGQAIVVHVPGIELRSQNKQLRGITRGARMAGAAKVKTQRAQVTLALQAATARPPALPLLVTVTRVAPSPLDAHDNLPPACKAVVDAIAAWVGFDDRDPGFTWRYDQRRDGSSYGVTIRVEAAPCA